MASMRAKLPRWVGGRGLGSFKWLGNLWLAEMSRSFDYLSLLFRVVVVGGGGSGGVGVEWNHNVDCQMGERGGV